MSDKPTLKDLKGEGVFSIIDIVISGDEAFVEVDVSKSLDTPRFTTRTIRIQLPHPHDFGPEFDGRPAASAAPDLSTKSKIKQYIYNNITALHGMDADAQAFLEKYVHKKNPSLEENFLIDADIRDAYDENLDALIEASAGYKYEKDKH